jgi:hypothetical protein
MTLENRAQKIAMIDFEKLSKSKIDKLVAIEVDSLDEADRVKVLERAAEILMTELKSFRQ